MRSFFLTPEQYGQLKEHHARFNEPWTEDETEELRRMASEGIPQADMAGQLGRTPNAVKYKLQSLGLYVPKPASRPWTPEDESALVDMYRSGVSFADIAASFGRTENAVIARLIRLRAGILPEHSSAPEA